MSSLPNITGVRLGADPEVFIFTPLGEGEFISSIGMIGGTKLEPRPLPKDGFYVQEDNVLLEFNIPPCDTVTGFVDALNYGLKACKELLPEFHGIRTQASAHFNEVQLNTPEANMFGCTPDKNAWTGKMNPPPDLPTDGLRTSGGHIHVGYLRPTKKLNQYIIRAMDFYLGVPSILMDRDTERRKLYGKAGAYRDKVYGPEYRTLSSFWLGNDKKIVWAWEQTMRAVDHVNGMAAPKDDYISAMQEDIVGIINTGDVRAAEALCKKHDLAVV